jgi:chromosome segregation protein
MKLLRLNLHGFKSFADRTELEFRDGLTAIVGPNGCGKSNIADAIRWVLGEQRASALRGHKMEDAIFQGTTERRAVNRAEVSLVFSNTEGRLAVPQAEVEIRRTVFREGGSDYALNKSACRLKDIFDLFRDTGLGANSYAIIEQGMVDRVLSDRADERRMMFEEAAGIGRYKDRRKAAQRRLEQAEQDLFRLEDVLREVESQVRSLARQSKRAQRYQELRGRRLALEVAVATVELEEARARLAHTAERLERLSRDEPAARGALSAAETELERLRLEAGEVARERGTAAARVEAATRRIAERERELAVADERSAAAERRLAQLHVEREELGARVTVLEQELIQLDTERGDATDAVRAGGERVSGVLERQGAIRGDLAAVRRADEEARNRQNELTRRLTQLEAEAGACDARAAEAEARLQHLGGEEEELATEFTRLDEQGDLFSLQLKDLDARRETLEGEVEAASQRLEALRSQELGARRAVAEAEEHSNGLAAHASALEALEHGHSGYAPAVAAALDARNQLEGLKGPLAEFLKLPPERAAAVESTLGSLLQALVITDDAASDRLREWLAGVQTEKGTLALLPEDAIARVESLIEAMEFVGDPPPEPVLLGRRERILALRREADEAGRERSRRAGARAALAEQVADAEAALRDARSLLEQVLLERRRASADEEARATQLLRAERARDELARRRAELKQGSADNRERALAARSERRQLEQELGTHAQAAAGTAARLSTLEGIWERSRDEESDARVALARAEAALAAVERRIAGSREALQLAAGRRLALEKEQGDNRAVLEQMSGVQTGAGADLEELFRLRDTAVAALRQLDDRLAGATDRADALESEARSLRRSVEEQAEERHRLELQRAESESAERRVKERLEAEWGRPWEQLAQMAAAAGPVTNGPEPGRAVAVDVLRAQLTALTADIERLGPINMLAIEEHEEEARRLAFLSAQQKDLVSARDDLQSAIRQINRTARQLFMDTFEKVRANFRDTFGTLFDGGECDVWLEDPEDPLESDIEILASPRGKRTQRIHLLSGGERALTALALLFAIYLVKPSPFCVLDEVDAPLDEANIGRFLQMLQKFKADTQFIVITHNPRTMEAADWIYGVTMEELGISTVVGVRLDDVLTDNRRGTAPSAPNAPSAPSARTA